MAADGVSSTEIEQRLEVSRPTVLRLRNRYRARAWWGWSTKPGLAATTTFRPGHHRARRVQVPWALKGIRRTFAAGVAAAAMIRVDGQEAGELALAAGVRLQADRVVAGDRHSICLELGDHPRTPTVAFVGSERMHVGEAGPRQRLHLDCGIQLHRARPEWDHGAIEREILVGETTEIAEHLVFGVIPREHRLCQELVGAPTAQAFGLGVVETRRRCRTRRATSRRSSSVEVSSKLKPIVMSSTNRRSRPAAAARASTASRRSAPATCRTRCR